MAAADVEAGGQPDQPQPDETPRCTRAFATAMLSVMFVVILCAVVELWLRNPELLHMPPHRAPPPPMAPRHP